MHPSPCKWAQTQTGSGGKIPNTVEIEEVFQQFLWQSQSRNEKMPLEACPAHSSKKDINDGLGSVRAPGNMGNLQLHARTTSTPHGGHFRAFQFLLPGSYRNSTRGKNYNAVCFHAEKAEISMNWSPYSKPDPSKAEPLLELLHKQPSITSWRNLSCHSRRFITQVIINLVSMYYLSVDAFAVLDGFELDLSWTKVLTGSFTHSGWRICLDLWHDIIVTFLNLCTLVCILCLKPM